MAAAARELRSRALLDGVPQRLALDLPRNSYVVARSDEVRLPPEITFASVNGGESVGRDQKDFYFFPNGSILGGEIVIADDAKAISYSIRLEALTGKVEVARGSDHEAHGRGKSSDGFTLLEVLVAMTIVGLGVVTLLQVFSLGLRLQARSMSRNEAIVQGSRVMDELLARKRVESAAGRLGDGGRWTAQVRTVRDAPTSLGLSGNWELKEVALEMAVRDGGRERQVELKTLRLARQARFG